MVHLGGLLSTQEARVALGYRLVRLLSGLHTANLKPRPNDRNMPTQHVATMLAKRTQHVAPNNVATCCVCMLRSFGRGLSWQTRVKPRPNDRNVPTQHFATLLGATCLRQQCCDMLQIWPNARPCCVFKLEPTTPNIGGGALDVALACCDRLAGALEDFKKLTNSFLHTSNSCQITNTVICNMAAFSPFCEVQRK